MRRTASRLILLLVAIQSLMGQPAFVRQDISVGLYPGPVLAGDFNGDGHLDLAVGTADFFDPLFRQVVAILLNEGGGKLGLPIQAARHQPTRSMFVADFNGDGKDDLLTGDNYLHISRGDGTFLPPVPIGDEHRLSPLGVGDINHDARPDVVALADIDHIRIWEGDGEGAFRVGSVLSVTGASWAVVADFNQDEKNDLLTFGQSPQGYGLLVFPGSGDGALGPAIRTITSNPGASVFVADYDGDSLLDIASFDGIMLGKGDGSFRTLLPAPPFEANPLVAAAELTGDDRADLVSHSVNAVGVYPGVGDGTFAQPTWHTVGWQPGGAVAVDLNEDDLLDLAVVSSLSGTVSVLMARNPEEPVLPRAVSTASDTAIVAPGSLATLLTSSGAVGSSAASPPWPTQLGGIALEVRDSVGVTRPAPLVFVSGSQINFQVPSDTALGVATLSIVRGDGTVEAGTMQVDAVAPGLFMVSHWNAVPAATATMVEHDGSQIPIPVYTCSPSPSGTACRQSAIPLAAAGDRPIYLTFYGTGFRGADLEDVACFMDAFPAPVVYAGPQGALPGLDQINVRVPPEVLQGSFLGSNVILRIKGVMANTAALLWREFEL